MEKTRGMTKKELLKKLLELDNDIEDINGLDFISHDMRSGCIEIDIEGSTEKEITRIIETIHPMVLENKKKRLEELKVEKHLLEGHLIERLM